MISATINQSTACTEPQKRPETFAGVCSRSSYYSYQRAGPQPPATMHHARRLRHSVAIGKATTHRRNTVSRWVNWRCRNQSTIVSLHHSWEDPHRPATHEFCNVNAKFRGHRCNRGAILCVVSRLGTLTDLRQAAQLHSTHRQCDMSPGFGTQ